MKILIVDNDRDWVEMLTSWLKKLGYEVYREYTGERAKIVWEKQQPDLVILDTNLKDVDALKMCWGMRGKHDALVLVTTNDQDPQLRVMCLESGADDYLLKPYSPAQLPAYINDAVARRGRLNLAEIPSSIITVGPICVDASHLEVSIDGKTKRLTAMESMVLHFLAVNANTVCTDSQIGSYIWRVNNGGNTTLIKVYIRRLRQKVEPGPLHPTYILTVPGVGYMLVSHDLDEAMQNTSTDQDV
jgi:DNA-binding response OmpR family regulator